MPSSPSRSRRRLPGGPARRRAITASPTLRRGDHAVPLAHLRSCDVLLYQGTGWLAEAIRFFDGTPYNHAGLYLGDETVAEALAPGVVRQSLSSSVAGRVEVLVRRLKQDVPTMDPVRERGLAIVAEGQRYAYEQLLLLAVLCLTRKVKVTPALAPLVRKTLDSAASLVAGWTAGGRQPMICSEFVYRTFDEALPEAIDVYRLEIAAGTRAPAAMRGERAAALPAGRPTVHPDSLLAWRLSRATRTWSPPAGPPALGSPASRARAGAGPDLETLIRVYLSEAREDSPRARPASLPDLDLAGAIDRFALAMTPPTSRARGPLAEEAAVRHLAEVAADFVTPGDLLKTDSLFTVGTTGV